MGDMTITSGVITALKAWAAGLRPRPALEVSEWADKYRRLPQEGASEPGPWRTDRVPFLREIMDCLSVHSPVKKVVFKKSSQVGGTECGLNWVGYMMMHAPAPMLVIQPTLDMAEKWSQQRLDGSIAASPEWEKFLPPRKTRSADNKALSKKGAGFILFITGANSASSLASMPIQYVMADEVDRYPDDVDEEGDPLFLAERRQATFPRRKTLIVSTPTIKDASRVDTEFEKSDQRFFYVPCPHCDEKQVLKWPMLKWDQQLSRAWYVCEHCGSEIEEHHKTAMLAAGHWQPKFPERAVRGYHINALYTPVGLGDTWLDHAITWMAAQQDPARLKGFVNTVLGECWEDRTNEVKPHALQARAEGYALRTIPLGCLLLTAGVDTQDDRLAVQIVGWGRRETAWIIDWLEIPGDPGRPEVWEKLDKLLSTPIRNQFGYDMRIEAVCVDSGGHHTHDVYNYCRTRYAQRVLAIKGATVQGKPILGKPSDQDVNFRGRTLKSGVKLWSVGTDTAKSTLYARLAGDAETDMAQRRVRFSEQLPTSYYEQLTAEAYDPEKRRWTLRRGRRNEALDTFVYAMAAAMHPELRVHVARDADWEARERLLQPRIADMFVQDPPDITQPAPLLAASEATTASPAPRGASSFKGSTDEGYLLPDVDDYWKD